MKLEWEVGVTKVTADKEGGPSKGLFIELKFLADKLKCITSVSCCLAHWWVVDPV